MKTDQIKPTVRRYYARRAETGTSCCGASGCGSPEAGQAARIARSIGYTNDELRAVPAGANLGLGCGNPTGLADLPEGATVLDLGSGAGFDSFLAARQIGPGGRVIGVDMTPEMVDRARANAAQGGYENVSFRLGEIEDLPVETASVDVVISNCVINLSPDMPRVFAEAYRVLRPGGRLLVSDLALARPLPRLVRQSARAYAGCIGGAVLRDTYLGMIERAGFDRIELVGEEAFLTALLPASRLWDQLPAKLGERARQMLGRAVPVLSLKVRAEKAL